MEDRPLGTILSIANQKGGVGKTTTAVNLAAALADAHSRCLLIDCDPQGNATTGMGIDRTGLGKGTYDLLMGNTPWKEIALPTPLPHLSLIGANPPLVGAEVEMASLPGKEFFLKKSLSDARDHFDYILLDCPPSLGYLTLNALTAGNAVLVPLQCEYYALEGLSQLLQTIRAVKKRLNPALKIAGILLTMYDKRNNLSAQVATEVRDHFRDIVYGAIIPRNVRLSEAPSHGRPILLYDGRCPGAQSYMALAKEILAGRAA